MIELESTNRILNDQLVRTKVFNSELQEALKNFKMTSTLETAGKITTVVGNVLLIRMRCFNIYNSGQLNVDSEEFKALRESIVTVISLLNRQNSNNLADMKAAATQSNLANQLSQNKELTRSSTQNTGVIDASNNDDSSSVSSFMDN